MTVLNHSTQTYLASGSFLTLPLLLLGEVESVAPKVLQHLRGFRLHLGRVHLSEFL